MRKYADNMQKWLISRAGAVRMCYNGNASAVTENKEADGRRSTARVIIPKDDAGDESKDGPVKKNR